MQGNLENLENSFWWSGGRFPKIWGGRGDGPCIRPPIFCIRSPQCNREKFKWKMTKKVVRNSENVDIFGGPRTETKFVKWSATRKRLRTAVIDNAWTRGQKESRMEMRGRPEQHLVNTQTLRHTTKVTTDLGHRMLTRATHK